MIRGQDDEMMMMPWLQRMGYETTRFQGEVDEELICPICSAVLEVRMDQALPPSLVLSVSI